MIIYDSQWMRYLRDMYCLSKTEYSRFAPFGGTDLGCDLLIL